MIPERYAPHMYAVMRSVFALMFLTAGLTKFGFLGGQAAPLGTWPLGIAGPIEVLTGTLILIGFLTSPAAFIASGMMAVAYFTAHQPQGLLPVQNQGMPAVLLCFAFLYMAARGSGIWSVDAARRGSLRGRIPRVS